MLATILQAVHVWAADYKAVLLGIALSIQVAVMRLLLSRWPIIETCKTNVLCASELVKMMVAYIVVRLAGQEDAIYLYPLLSVVPTIGYAVGSMMMWWALPYVQASLGIVLAQLKLPFTAFFAFVFLGKRISYVRILALGMVVLGCIGMTFTDEAPLPCNCTAISLGEMETIEVESYSKVEDAGSVGLLGMPLMAAVAVVALVGEAAMMGGMAVFSCSRSSTGTWR